MNNRLSNKRNVTSVCALALATMFLFSNHQPVIVRAQSNTATHQGVVDKSKAGQIVEDIRSGRRGPLYAGYYRTWHDEKATKNKEAAGSNPSEIDKPLGGLNRMSDAPKEVDILFVFDSFVHEKSPFWTTLRNDYVPKLHKKGTAVVQTIGIKFLTGEAGLSVDSKTYPDTDEGNQKLAKAIVDTYVKERGVDGLDIDIEAPDYDVEQKPKEAKRALAVFKEIAKLIGKDGADKSKLLIIDTTLAPDKNPLFTETAKSIDFLLRQYYGNQDGSDGFKKINEEWLQFKEHIKSEQFMPGFSFFEENTPDKSLWFDVDQEDSNEETRAEKYAKWQPQTGGLKGGIFSYAIDRDGVIHPSRRLYSPHHKSNEKVKTEYKFSQKLKKMMTDDERNKTISEKDIHDEILRKEIMKQVGRGQGNFDLFDGTLVINNPEITSLKGLENFKNVKKIVIDGLKNIKELSTNHFPESLKYENGQTDSVIEIKNMPTLETIDLSNLKIQTLDGIDFKSMPLLKTVDISQNAIDFSLNSKDYTTLTSLLDNRKQVTFDKQRPKGYVPNRFGNSKVQWDKSGNAINLIDAFLTGGQTVSGRTLFDERSFNEMVEEKIHGQTFIDPNYKFDEFKVNYSDYTVDIVDHRLVRSKEKTLVPSQDSVYKITFKDPADKEVLFADGANQAVLTVGSGADTLDDLAVGAKELYRTGVSDSRLLFDGKYESGEIYKEYQDRFVVFELLNPGVAQYWNLYRSGYGIGGSNGDVIQASLKILKNEEAYYELLSNSNIALEYLKNEDNWQEISSFSNDVSGTTLSLPITVQQARIFKVHFQKSSDGYGVASVELQIVGKKLANNETIVTPVAPLSELKAKQAELSKKQESIEGTSEFHAIAQQLHEINRQIEELEGNRSSSWESSDEDTGQKVEKELELNVIPPETVALQTENSSETNYIDSAYETVQELVSKAWKDISEWALQYIQ
ncbi:hypothetical protein AB6M97_01110 [Streptococcus hillyeri]|uniref:mannosyl-glycoprotein endo-beta-N-acetylglucosaminidase n=1 Tax=Streptococcus hillyeri TaxID=2282420 RepID=A0A3L9DVN2_9STRE|nr:hypothetical protein [Streptococcus hillyeri]RLY03947.1 hypothetical protein EAF07_03965 [Streptococcus hillyeri]